MIINKEEVEKAAEEYIKTQRIKEENQWAEFAKKDFKAGIEFSEEYVQKYVGDIIIENQGLKLYKDNEAERFKELAVEFGEWILQNDNPGFKLVFGDGFPNKWGSVRQGGGYNTTEELYELFLKQRNEKN
jgi:hypothetical protein